MNEIAIEVEGLGKRYRIGAQQERYRTLRETLVSNIKRMAAKRTGQSTNNSIWALKDVSFAVKRGEVVGIIGRNGAGKSTLLKVLSHITEPTQGRVVLYGRVGSLLEVGTGFHPELTGRENIYLNGAILGMKKTEIERKFDEIVEFSEIEKFLDTPVKHYSSGMYVRLAFAVAAHLEPQILLIDEILSVGDIAFQNKCLGKMGEIARQGRTVLFVSHNLSALLNLCPQAILLKEGSISCQGRAEMVVSEYASGNQQCNFFDPLMIVDRRGDQRARIVDFKVHPSPPRTGMQIEFAFEIGRSNPGQGSLIAELGIAVLSDRYTPLFQLHSGHMGRQFEIPGGNFTVKVTVNKLPLAPGRYHLNLWLGSGEIPIDWLLDCYTLLVEPGCFVENSYVDFRGYPVVVPSQWITT